METKPYSESESARHATFVAAAAGWKAYRLAVALHLLHPGIDFRGMGKRNLADEFARGWLKDVSGAQLRAALSKTLKENP